MRYLTPKTLAAKHGFENLHAAELARIANDIAVCFATMSRDAANDGYNRRAEDYARGAAVIAALMDHAHLKARGDK
jgi:hypothetical protein